MTSSGSARAGRAVLAGLRSPTLRYVPGILARGGRRLACAETGQRCPCLRVRGIALELAQQVATRAPEISQRRVRLAEAHVEPGVGGEQPPLAPELGERVRRPPLGE